MDVGRAWNRRIAVLELGKSFAKQDRVVTLLVTYTSVDTCVHSGVSSGAYSLLCFCS